MIIFLGICILAGLCILGQALEKGFEVIASAIRCYPHVEHNVKKEPAPE